VTLHETVFSLFSGDGVGRGGGGEEIYFTVLILISVHPALLYALGAFF
jgi:hypothetical protein